MTYPELIKKHLEMRKTAFEALALPIVRALTQR